MKLAITAKQIVHFRKNGHVRLEDVPCKGLPLATTEEADLWRKNPQVKKWIQRTLAPIAFELLGKNRLRLACDRTLISPLPEGRFQDLFCFQGLACIALVSKTEEEFALDVFEPSHLTSKIPPSSFYLVALGLETCVFINNPKDARTHDVKNLGYVFGDRLQNTLHPLLV